MTLRLLRHFRKSENSRGDFAGLDIFDFFTILQHIFILEFLVFHRAGEKQDKKKQNTGQKLIGSVVGLRLRVK